MDEKISTALMDIENSYDLNLASPGFVCFIQNEDDIVYTRSTGVQDDMHTPLSPESVFRIASITKQFTAAAILQLVDQTKISLQTPIVDVLPDFPEYGKAITIHQLLTHTSGIRDYEDFTDIDVVEFRDQNALEVLNKFDDLEFAPGSKYHYSNTGYCILALVIAKISGTSYAQYMKSNIFAPAAMKDAQVGTEPQISRRVYGYSWASDGWTKHDQDTFTHTEGDGGIYASAAELVRWQNALHSKKTILSDTALRLMTTSHTATNYKGEDYGYGIAITTIDATRCYLHHGVSSGFENALFYLPEQKCSIVLLSNMRHENFNAISLGKQIVSQYLRSNLAQHGSF